MIQDDQNRKAKERLVELLLAGINSGESIPVDAHFPADLKSEALAKLESRTKVASRK